MITTNDSEGCDLLLCQFQNSFLQVTTNAYEVLLASLIYVAILQRFYTTITNACFCVVVDPCNATYGNAYLSVGVDLTNTYIDIWQRIDALVKGVSCCSTT
jgi:hypothetical protein